MTPARTWIPVIPLEAVERGWVTPVTVNGRPYAIYDTPAGIYASFANCTHGGALLSDGYFDRFTIECPLHQGCFDVRNGAATGAPATRALPTIPVRVREGMVELSLPSQG
jgi:naphthalene 1,2-dioxygenase ferredoxin component